MARTDTPSAEDHLTRKLGPLPVWAWAAIGVGLALWYSKKSGSKTGSTAASVLSSPFGYSTAAQQQAAALGAGSLSAYYPTGYGNYSSTSDLADVLSQLSTQITALGGGNSGTNQSTAPSPGNTQTGAANQTSPAFTPYGVGTIVSGAPGSKITDVINFDQGGKQGAVSVSSTGGLYTSPGFYVTGSAAGVAGAKPPPGGYSAVVNPTGTTVYEDTATGLQTYQIKPAAMRSVVPRPLAPVAK